MSHPAHALLVRTRSEAPSTCKRSEKWDPLPRQLLPQHGQGLPNLWWGAVQLCLCGQHYWTSVLGQAFHNMTCSVLHNNPYNVTVRPILYPENDKLREAESLAEVAQPGFEPSRGWK